MTSPYPACPSCSKTPDYVAGPVMQLLAASVDPERNYFVCWRCMRIAARVREIEWMALRRRPKKWQPTWTKHTAYHWQARFNGEPIDYWPSKRKWRFQGETHRGGEKDIKRCMARFQP